MNRPSFSSAWAASMRIYDPVTPSERVAKIIGGYVEKNINNPDPTQRWVNTYAVCMCYILNKSGLLIPKITGQTVSGANRQQYFYRVKDLIRFLQSKWGNPEVEKYPPSNGSLLSGKKGMILFEVSGWSDANGHATLFNGMKCYDHCYFNEPESRYRTERAYFWSLP